MDAVFNMEENRKNFPFEDVYTIINAFFGDSGLKRFINSKISQYTSERVYKKMEKLYEKFSDEEKKIADFLVYIVEGKRDVLVYTDDKTFNKIRYEDIYKSIVGEELKGKDLFIGNYVKIEKRFELLEKVLKSIEEKQDVYKNLVKYIAPFIYEKIKRNDDFRMDCESYINNKFKLRHLKYALMNVKLAYDEKKNNNYRISYLDIYASMALGEPLRDRSSEEVLNGNEGGNADDKEYTSTQPVPHTETVPEERDTSTLEENVSPEKENIEEQHIQNTSTQIAEQVTSESEKQENSENKNSGINKKTLLVAGVFGIGGVGILWLPVLSAYLINSCSQKITTTPDNEKEKTLMVVKDIKNKGDACLDNIKEYATKNGGKVIISGKEGKFNVVYVDKDPERKGLITTDNGYVINDKLKNFSNNLYKYLTKRGCNVSEFQVYKTKDYVGWGAKFDRDGDGKVDGVLWLASARLPHQKTVSIEDTIEEKKVKKEEGNVEIKNQLHAEKEQFGGVEQSGSEKRSGQRINRDREEPSKLTITQIMDSADGKNDGKYLDSKFRCEDELNRCVVGADRNGGLYRYDNEERDWAIPKSYRDALFKNGFVVSENGIARVFNEDTNKWKEIISYDLYYYPKDNGEIIKIEVFEEKPADVRGRLVF